MTAKAFDEISGCWVSEPCCCWGSPSRSTIRCGEDGTDQPMETELGDGCVSGHGSVYEDKDGDGEGESG